MRTRHWAVLLAVGCCAAARAAQQEPEISAIRDAARRTEASLTTRTASWTAVHAQGPREVRLDVISTPEGRRMSFSSDVQRAPRELTSVVERDGRWYVAEVGRAPVKCRPHEYPFLFVNFPLYQQRSGLPVLTELERGHLGTFEGRQGSRATYRAPLDPAAARQVEQILEQIDARAGESPEGLSPQLQAQVATIQEVLRRGLPVVVDLDHGFYVQYGSANLSTRIENFRYLDQPPPGALDVANRQWEDRTGGPLGADGVDVRQLVMLLHSPTWRPGLPKQDADGRILDLESGRIWRIPFPGVGSIPGCFLRGRRSVLVTGCEPESATYGLYRIDLEDTAVERLGGDALATGMVADPALSPDGRTVAVMHMRSVGRPDDRQVYVIDLDTGHATPVGRSINAKGLSWLPEGKALIVVRMDWPQDDARKSWTGMVCRLDLDGKLTELFRAASAVVLDNDRLLFEEQPHRTWKTCDLNGNDVKPFGDGLKDYFFPAPSPDGRRIILIRNDPLRGPTPFLFNVDGTGGTAATETLGLWSGPQWR